MRTSSSIALLFFLAAATAARGAERCAIENAVFAEIDAGTELAFRPVQSESAVVNHLFAIAAGKITLEGHVMYDPDVERPAAMIMNDCPEGDVTGDDLRACTVWAGTPYALLRATGQIDIIGPEGSDAPDAVLLPSFGPALRRAPAWEKSGLGDIPWDLYEFKECKAA